MYDGRSMGGKGGALVDHCIVFKDPAPAKIDLKHSTCCNGFHFWTAQNLGNLCTQIFKSVVNLCMCIEVLTNYSVRVHRFLS